MQRTARSQQFNCFFEQLNQSFTNYRSCLQNCQHLKSAIGVQQQDAKRFHLVIFFFLPILCIKNMVDNQQLAMRGHRELLDGRLRGQIVTI